MGKTPNWVGIWGGIIQNSDLVGNCSAPAHPCRLNFEFELVPSHLPVCDNNQHSDEHVDDRNNNVQILVRLGFTSRIELAGGQENFYLRVLVECQKEKVQKASCRASGTIVPARS